MTASSPSLPRVLYVEDHFESSVILRKMLARDCVVDLSSTQEDALAKLTAAPYRVILLDINLGTDQSDGLALLRRVRALPGYELTPIIAVTAYALEGDREYFITQGFSDYVAKPVSLADLREKLRTKLAETSP